MKKEDSGTALNVSEPNQLDKREDSAYFTCGEINNVRIKDLDILYRPIEKMILEGKESLTDNELFAILLGSGTKGVSAIELAYKILTVVGNHEQLMDVTIEELTSIKGVGKTKAARIIAGLELGKRISKKRTIRTLRINSPQSIAQLFMENDKYEEKEHFSILMLDTKNQIIGIGRVSTGDLNSSIVNPREVFKLAIKRSAHSIVLVHNHPSGDPNPSKNDIAITQRLMEGSKILGIKILDHIIIGFNRYYSMRENNIIN